MDTIVFNSRVLFAHHYSLSCNKIAQWFTDINIWLFVRLFGMHVFYCYILLLSLSLSLSVIFSCMFSMFYVFVYFFSFSYYGPCVWNKDMMMMMMMIMPHDSPGTLSFLMPKIMAKFEWDHPLPGQQLYWWLVAHSRIFFIKPMTTFV